MSNNPENRHGKRPGTWNGTMKNLSPEGEQLAKDVRDLLADPRLNEWTSTVRKMKPELKEKYPWIFAGDNKN